MKRLPDHLNRFNIFIDKVRYKPFKWGKWDCTRFAAANVAMLTGVFPMEEFKNRYDDKISAVTLLRSEGQGTLLGTLIKKFGEPQHMGHAWRGDLVFDSDRRNVGVCNGKRGMFVGKDGLIFHDLEEHWPVFFIR